MAVAYTVQNGTTKVTHEFVGDTTKLQKLYNSAAHYLWDHGRGDHGTEETPIVWEDLTNQDKADIVHAHLMQVIKDNAKTYLNTAAKDIAGVAADTEYNETTEINDLE
jgi:hypothetical protein